MFEELFLRKTMNGKKALKFGFAEAEGKLCHEREILGGMFRLRVVISDENVQTDLTETETGDEYILYKTNAAGPFVGEVRGAVEAVLAEVAAACYDEDLFRSAQAEELIRYVRKTYGDELEFLWPKHPDNAIWRRRDSGKWYGALLTISLSKLGIESEERAAILDLHTPPEKMEELLQTGKYYPGWHMNKKHWFTVILNGSVETEEICRRIDESYKLAK